MFFLNAGGTFNGRVAMGMGCLSTGCPVHPDCREEQGEEEAVGAPQIGLGGGGAIVGVVTVPTVTVPIVPAVPVVPVGQQVG